MAILDISQYMVFNVVVNECIRNMLSPPHHHRNAITPFDDYRDLLLLKNRQVISMSSSRPVFTIASTLDMVVINCDCHDIAEKLLTTWR